MFGQGTGCLFIKCIYLNSVQNRKHTASPNHCPVLDKTQTRPTKHLLKAPLTTESYPNLVPFPTAPRELSQVISPSLPALNAQWDWAQRSELSQGTPGATSQWEKTTKITWAIPPPLNAFASTAVSGPLSFPILLSITRPNFPWKSATLHFTLLQYLPKILSNVKLLA